MKMWHSLAITLIFLAFQDYTASLRLLEVRVPQYVVNGTTPQLECIYDLAGESLYSVKWYKDGNEFYRYMPRELPHAQTFRLPGVDVELHNSNDAIITLRNVNLQSAGRYRCEVSGEAPAFETVTEHGDMVVVALPDQGPPKITGVRSRYQIGDWLHVNCTVGRSKPAAELSWFINEIAVEPHFLRKYETIHELVGHEVLETAVLGLAYRVGQHDFRNGDMTLKCIASLYSLYWRSKEVSIQNDDRSQNALSALESRGNAFTSSSSSSSHVKPLRLPIWLFLLLAMIMASLTVDS